VTGLRINEAAQLKIKDIFDPDGELRDSFRLPGNYQGEEALPRG